jgi:hypothetical protein
MSRARLRSSRPRLAIRIAACTGLALLELAWADDPVVDARALGMAESMVTYCARLDVATAARYQQKAKLLVQGASEEAIAKARKSEAYRAAYDSVTDFTSKIDNRNAKLACTGSANRHK